jgi:hypothetical protein
MEGHRRSDRLGRAALSRGRIGLEFAIQIGLEFAMITAG